jgi:RimJ/RimL family protein N-acetyltransferase
MTNGIDQEIYPRPLSGARVPKLPSALPPASRPLKGAYVELAPMDAALHASDLYQASHGSEEALGTWNYLADGPWPDVEAYADALRGQTAMLDRLYFAVRPLDQSTQNEASAWCGQASFLDTHPRDGVTEIGHIWFGAGLRQTRAATEALYLMIRHAMDDLGYRRMQWRCNAQNENSVRAAGRLGFRFEGIFYNHLIWKGKNRDTAWFSILDDEWPELDAIFRQWLDASNFTPDGRALTSLSEMTAARGPGERPV